MQYISREGSAVINVARYLLTAKEGDRVRTIDSLSEEFGVSVGFIQKALTTIESHQAVGLSKQGRNGTFISTLNETELAKLSGLSHLVCAMPLPYTKHYEGIASGIKAQMSDLPFYFAHMRGANVRAECLKAGTYDMAIMSRLAAKDYVVDGLVTAIDLGDHSYSNAHRLIYRDGEYSTITKVGVDSDSPDQRVLTELAFKDKQIEIVEINYSDSLSHLTNGIIDAVVWLPEAIDMLGMGLSERSLDEFEECRDASQAVILVRTEALYIRVLLRKLLNVHALISHQNQVVEGLITPSY